MARTYWVLSAVSVVEEQEKLVSDSPRIYRGVVSTRLVIPDWQSDDLTLLALTSLASACKEATDKITTKETKH